MTAPEKEGANLTPLIDIAFLILIFFMSLPFTALDAKLEAHLPRYKGIENRPVRPPQEFLIKVRILGRDELPRTWGDAEVPAPSRVIYRFASGRTTTDLDAVGAHIGRMKRAGAALPHTEVRGEINAAPRVQHKYAIAVLNQFLAQGVKKVDLHGARLPRTRDLRKRTLPYPLAQPVR